MYDKNRMKKFTTGLTVKDLIEALKEYPEDAVVDICGDNYCYIHVEENDSVVNIDNEDLEECYEPKETGDKVAWHLT